MNQLDISYPDGLSNEHLLSELKKHIGNVTSNQDVRSSIEAFLRDSAMVSLGYAELHRRLVERSSHESKILGRITTALGIITVIAALISISVSFESAQLAKDAGRMSEDLQKSLIQLQTEQSSVLKNIRDNITKNIQPSGIVPSGKPPRQRSRAPG